MKYKNIGDIVGTHFNNVLSTLDQNQIMIFMFGQ